MDGDLAARLQQLFAAIAQTQPPPDIGLVALGLVVAAGMVYIPRCWRVTRHVMTIFHEGGHSAVSVLVGERNQRIRLHLDTSGVTESVYVRGRPMQRLRALPVILAGYTATCALGVGMAWALSSGHATAVLWTLLVLLLLILVRVRNVWGWISVLSTLAFITLSTWFLPAVYQTLLVTCITCLFFLGGLKTAWEQRRSAHLGGGSDAHQLSSLLRLPLAVSLWAFILVDASLCVGGGYLLLAAVKA